jgi:hypothetical protein
VLLVPFYLAARGLGAFEIGVVATSGLFGSALTTIAIGFVSRSGGAKVVKLWRTVLGRFAASTW